MERQAGAPRVITTGRVHEDDVRTGGETADGGLEERSVAEREQASDVRGCGSAGRHRDAELVVDEQRGGGPARLVRRAGTDAAPSEADEAAGHGAAGRRRPRWWMRRGELFLRRDERVGGRGPARVTARRAPPS